MSLLMDALKKAEQEKKAAVNRLEDTDDRETENTADVDDSIISKEITGEHKVPIEELGALKGGKSGDFTSTAELTLAPIERLEDREEQSPDAVDPDKSVQTEDVTLNVTMSDLNLDPLPDLQDGMDEQNEADLQHEATVAENLNLGSDTVFDETFHGVSLGEDDPELFQETMQGEAYVPEQGNNSYEETLPGVPAVQFAKDIGGEDLPTPVAAQTVFTATNTVNRSSSGFKWLLVGLVSIAVISAGVWYYYTVTPMNRVLPSPQVAKGIENIVPNQLPDTFPQQVMSGSLNDTVDEEVSDGVAEVEIVEESLAAGPESVEDVSEPDLAVAANEQTDEEVIDVVQQTEAQAARESPRRDDAIRAQATRPSLPESVENLNDLFKISRSKPSGEKNSVLMNAYQAYQQGDFDTAKLKYTDILRSFPDNRDALLGLAAISLGAGDVSRASIFYSQILKLNPQDDMVRAILVNLQGNDLLSDISSMKSMIQANPEQPIAHFTLGNTYAKQGRWAEAQQAFFDAYRLDSSNPDYAFNLAVSLDHINQRNTALDYYNVALKLADEKSVRFDPATAMNRIRDLSAEN